MNRHLARNGVLMLGFLLWAFAPTSRSQDQTTGVLLTQPGHWTLGVLVNNVWSVAGSGSRPDVNQYPASVLHQLQHEEGLVHHLATDPAADWTAASGNQWTVPFGGGVGRIMKLGYQPVSLTGQFYGNAVHPANTPAWGMRLQIAFLFPKLSKEQQKMLLEKKLKEMDQEQAPRK